MFNRILSDKAISEQIAALINGNNRLNKYYSHNEILAESSTFIVESLGPIVTGCVQIQKQAYMLSEIRRLVIHPRMRRQGLAKTLIAAAVNKSDTPMVYATVRKDNLGSKKAFEACGFVNVGHYTTGARDILMYVTTCPKWKKQVDSINNHTYNRIHRR